MTSSLSRHTRPRRIHEDPAHHLRGNGKEMGPIFPVGPADTDEAQERFVDQSPAFEGVAVSFVSHVPARSTAEVIIDVWNQLSQSAGVPSTGSHKGARPSKARAPCQQQAAPAIKAATTKPDGADTTTNPLRR